MTPWRAGELLLALLYLAAAFAIYARRRSREQRALAATLRRERDFADAVIDTADALILALDRQGRIVRFNRACERLTGYRAHEVADWPFWDFFLLPDELSRVQGVFADLCAGRFPNTHENHWRTRDGGQRLILWRNTALPDGVGAVEYVIATGIDVTDERATQAALRAREELWRAVFEGASAGIAVVDLTGHIIEANPAAQALLGYSADELRGRAFADYTHPDDIAEGLQLFGDLAAGRLDRYSRAKRYLRPDGGIVWGWMTAVLVRYPDGAPRFVVGILEDITAHKAAEARVTELQSGLSPQEWRVLPLLARFELTYEQIAFSLNMGSETVKTHKQRIAGKLGVPGRRAVIVAAARERGWLPAN